MLLQRSFGYLPLTAGCEGWSWCFPQRSGRQRYNWRCQENSWNGIHTFRYLVCRLFSIFCSFPLLAAEKKSNPVFSLNSCKLRSLDDCNRSSVMCVLGKPGIVKARSFTYWLSHTSCVKRINACSREDCWHQNGCSGRISRGLESITLLDSVTW